MGLLAISSCAIGLLIAMVLVSKDSALVTSRIQAITVIDVGRFFIKRVLAPNARHQRRAHSMFMKDSLPARPLQAFVGRRPQRTELL
jgi:hypothetical protein